MMKIPRFEEYKNIEENIIKYIKNLFRFTKIKKADDAETKGIRNLFRLQENKTIKDRIIIDIRNLSEHEEEGYYKSVRAGNFWSNNYIEYKSKGDRKI